jgi:hypothetical protein
MVALTDVVVDERFDPKEEAGDRYTNDLADGSTHDHWPQMDSACRDTAVRVVPCMQCHVDEQWTM